MFHCHPKMRKQFSRIHLEQVFVRSGRCALSLLPFLYPELNLPSRSKFCVLLRFSSHLSRVVSFAYATWPGIIRKNEERVRRLYKTVERRRASSRPSFPFVSPIHFVGSCRSLPCRWSPSEIYTLANSTESSVPSDTFDKMVRGPTDLYKTVMRHCACKEQNHKPCLPWARLTWKGDFYSGGRIGVRYTCRDL